MKSEATPILWIMKRIYFQEHTKPESLKMSFYLGGELSENEGSKGGLDTMENAGLIAIL